MTTGDGAIPPLTVDPELLERYGNQLLTAAGGLPEAPPPALPPNPLAPGLDPQPVLSVPDPPSPILTPDQPRLGPAPGPAG